MLCLTPHAEDREALPSLRLCASCREHLGANLTALPKLYRDLAEVHADPAPPRTFHLQRPPGQDDDRDPLTIPETRLPIRPEVTDLRDQIRHDLAWWTFHVAGARGLDGPPSAEPHETAAWLARQADWLSAQPQSAEEAPGVFGDLVRRARALIAPTGTRRLCIGPCPTDGDDGPCDGSLYATVRGDDDPRPSAITCRTCGLSLPPEMWRRFGRDYLRNHGPSGRMTA